MLEIVLGRRINLTGQTRPLISSKLKSTVVFAKTCSVSSYSLAFRNTGLGIEHLALSPSFTTNKYFENCRKKKKKYAVYSGNIFPLRTLFRNRK